VTVSTATSRLGASAAGREPFETAAADRTSQRGAVSTPRRAAARALDRAENAVLSDGWTR
jgi:hypothetical protein